MNQFMLIVPVLLVSLLLIAVAKLCCFLFDVIVDTFERPFLSAPTRWVRAGVAALSLVAILVLGLMMVKAVLLAC